jgi:uncharacterized protein YjbI with pentapeptide repeats
MFEKLNIRTALNKILTLNAVTVGILVVTLLILIFLVVDNRQQKAVEGVVPPTPEKSPVSAKEPFEIAKLRAEIEQIRSDTSGSLFWLKLIAVFVTVGGAVGGYLLAQTRASRDRIEFEDRKNVDLAYQSIVQELSNDSPLLRAAAAVKLGSILSAFPSEWNVNEERKLQLQQLTKDVLAAALATEENEKVLKTITIAIAKHKNLGTDFEGLADLRGIDMSGAKAADAYWAKADFTYADFFKANLNGASFRKSILRGAQFRESILTNAVFCDADCTHTNFKFADLRNADFTGAKLSHVNFEEAKVYGVKLAKAEIEISDEIVKVDLSPNSDGTKLVTVEQWLKESELEYQSFRQSKEN